MLIIFICGLSPEIGHKFIDSVIEMGQNDLPFGEECPDFCWAGWAASLEYIWDQLHTRKAENITPFILKCLWEMSETFKMRENAFPFRTNGTSPKRKISLQPDLNFKIISLKQVNELVESEAVNFDKGILMHLYNLNDDESIKEDPTITFNCLPKETTYVFCLHNLKYKYISLFKWLENQKQLVKFYVSDVNMSQSDMRAVLETISVHLNTNLRTLFLRDVDLTGAENELCNTIHQLHCLYYFALRDATIAKGHAANICEVLSDKKKHPELERLDLSGTDFSSAKDKLSKAIASHCDLKELKLNNINMTKAQADEVCSVLAGSTSLVSLWLSSNNLRKAIDALTSNINQMDNLKDLNVSKCNINELQMMRLFLKLPLSITALQMWQAETMTEENESKIENQIQELENLEVVKMNLSENLSSRLIKKKCNKLEVCILFEENSKKPKIARCLKSILDEYDKFTSRVLKEKKETAE